MWMVGGMSRAKSSWLLWTGRYSTGKDEVSKIVDFDKMFQRSGMILI